MKSNEIFGAMSPAESEAFLAELKAEAPKVAQIALQAACGAFKLRPQFFRRQPKTRQAEWVRRALARRQMAPVAEEILAEYFLEHQGELLGEWLDAVGLEHEDGTLQDPDPKCPEKKELEAAVKTYRDGKEPERRALLLKAFASQSAIDWPDLEALL